MYKSIALVVGLTVGCAGHAKDRSHIPPPPDSFPHANQLIRPEIAADTMLHEQLAPDKTPSDAPETPKKIAEAIAHANDEQSPGTLYCDRCSRKTPTIPILWGHLGPSASRYTNNGGALWTDTNPATTGRWACGICRKPYKMPAAP